MGKVSVVVTLGRRFCVIAEQGPPICNGFYYERFKY